MSKANRKMVYDKLVAEGRLDQDDGALIEEFGDPDDKEKPKKKPKETKKPKKKSKKGSKKSKKKSKKKGD